MTQVEPAASTKRPSRKTRPNPRSLSILFELAIVTLTTLFLVAFALNLSPYLRGPDEWRWTYVPLGSVVDYWVPIATLITYLAVSLLCAKRFTGAGDLPTRKRRALLFLIALAIPAVQASLLSTPNSLRHLFLRTVSPISSGVFTVGSTIESGPDFLRRYPELMSTFPVHPQRYPPGLPLLFYLARLLLERLPSVSDAIGFYLRQFQCHDLGLMRLSNATIATSVIQMALPLVGGLTVFPLYGLARRTCGQRAAIWATILYPLIPSFALWSGRWDQLYPLLTCTSWELLHRGLTKANRRTLTVAGLVLSGVSFMSFGPLAILLPMGLFAVLWFVTHPEHANWRRLVGYCLAFGLGLGLPWIVYQLVFGTGLLDIWRVSMSFHLGLQRDYWTWLGYHLYDFFVFLGLPLTLPFLVSLIFSLHDLRDRQIALLPLSFGAGLLLLDVLGISRGEVARVWLFLTPFATIIAANGLARLRPCRIRTFAIVTVLLVTQLLVFNTFLRVVGTGLTDPPSRTPAFETHSIDHPLDARFRIDDQDAIALLGYDLEPESPTPGDALRITLYWQALRSMSQPYTVFTHLIGPEGQLVGQKDNMPQRNLKPTTCWVPGEIIADPYEITTSSHALPGPHTLEIGLYLWQTGERLPASGATATPDHRVILAQVSVAPE
jgi:hypothetical protein